LGGNQNSLSEARREAESTPSLENNNNFQQAIAKFLKAKIQARQTSWREKTASLNLEKDGTKLWKLTKQLNDEAGFQRGTTTLIEDDSLLTGKQAANKFADNYKDEIPTETRCPSRWRPVAHSLSHLHKRPGVRPTKRYQSCTLRRRLCSMVFRRTCHDCHLQDATSCPPAISMGIRVVCTGENRQVMYNRVLAVTKTESWIHQS